MEKGDEVARVKDSPTPFYSCAFGADGREAFAGAYAARLRRWAVKGDKLAERAALAGTSGYSHSLVFTPDGRRLITRGLDSRIVVWDVATGKRLRQMPPLGEVIGGLAVSADGRHLAVGLGTGDRRAAAGAGGVEVITAARREQ